jgi:hypothetical protein
MVRPGLGALLFSLVAAACGNSPDAASPSLTDPAHAAAGGEPAPSGSGAPANAGGAPNLAGGGEPSGAADGEPHRQRKPFPIHNSCSEVVTIVFGEDAKAAGDSRRTIAANSMSDGPRDAEGKQTVWLLDDKGESLVKVHITRGMKQLEIGRSCRTLDAH